MEILLIAACAWLAYQSGAQSEQSKLGLSPAQRDQMREAARHEKAVRRIAEKHKDAPVPADSTTAVRTSAPVPATFGSGYRSHRPARPPLGARAGEWTGRGVTWAQHTGRDAWQRYRERRKNAGHEDPGPVLVPVPPARPPDVPPIPTVPTTTGAEKDAADATSKPDEPAAPDAHAEAPKEPATAPSGDVDTSAKKPPEPEAADDPDYDPDGSFAHLPDYTTPPDAEMETPRSDTPPPSNTPGVGRMAADVTYESVEDETDDLSAMCEEDARVYDRVRSRAEREIGRGDDLVARLRQAGFGAKVIGWVTRCKEQYEVIHSQIDDLQKNTITQGEKVVEAKALLIAGQGVYAEIAKDMEDVAERDAYISDAVDAEDANAHSEVYETTGAA
ncbi:hypothetical protein [Streptomyces sp.]|uniref:hypothetical protein n=1 Tax=Streptomyces sp. TaxID=1931 RepID=UPI0028110148|nr:hypothetical protein [Streptomyces sp.]